MNYYELKYLKLFIKSKILDGEIAMANTRYKNLIEFFINHESGNQKLVFSTAPGNIALFIDYYSNPKKSNTISFFEDIYGLRILDVELAETDRILSILFENNYKLVFKLFSNSANVLLTKDNDLVASFKGNSLKDVEVPESKEIKLFQQVKSSASIKQQITSLNPLIPRNNLEVLIEANNLESFTEDELIEFAKKVSDQVNEHAEWRLLFNGNTALINEQYLPLKTERYFDSINDLIAYRYKSYSHNQRLRQQKSGLLKNINRQIKRTKSGLRNLEQADKSIDRAELYEKYGHLLMANGHLKTDRKNSIEVNDLYDEGNNIKIPLDEKISIIENAEKYYDKAKNSLNSYDEAQQRIPILSKKKQELEALKEQIEEIYSLRALTSWTKDHSKKLVEYGVVESKNSKDENAPFHTLTVQQYPVWIGKNARSNDKLVQMAHKEDVWMHARGVAGSHTLIRMGNSKEMPPKSVLLEVAAYAAYNSKAKGAELVPVIITKSKFVRKPKGAAPGAVLVDKEQVEFVSPKKPVL